MLGVLLSGLALTVLPVYLTSYVTRGGFTGSVFGAMFALPQPFCSCCSSVMAPSFVRRGASTTFLLSFIVGAPMLNVTTMLLAFAASARAVRDHPDRVRARDHRPGDLSRRPRCPSLGRSERADA